MNCMHQATKIDKCPMWHLILGPRNQVSQHVAIRPSEIIATEPFQRECMESSIIRQNEQNPSDHINIDPSKTMVLHGCICETMDQSSRLDRIKCRIADELLAISRWDSLKQIQNAACQPPEACFPSGGFIWLLQRVD